MKRVGLLLLLFSTVAVAAITHLAPEYRQVLEDSRFVPVMTLPASIVALCADENGRLAEPGEEWEATDVVSDASLPQKRLIWAMKSAGYYVVHYERGGRGHSFHIVVATVKNGEAAAVWRAVANPLQNYDEFLQELHAGLLHDDPKYAQ